MHARLDVLKAEFIELSGGVGISAAVVGAKTARTGAVLTTCEPNQQAFSRYA